MANENETTGMTATEYLELFKGIKDFGVDREVALVIFQEMAKDIRTNQIRHERQQRAGDGATEKQKAYLRRLGVEFSPSISFEQASKLIDNAASSPED